MNDGALCQGLYFRYMENNLTNATAKLIALKNVATEKIQYNSCRDAEYGGPRKPGRMMQRQRLGAFLVGGFTAMAVSFQIRVT